LQLLRLCVVLAIVVASVRKARRGLRTPGLACTSTTVGGGSSRGVESRRAVLQRQAETGELHLHLVYRLSAEVTDVEQVGLTPGHQLANRVDSLTLQAVVRPHRQVEVLDRHRVGGDGVSLLRRRTDLNAFGINVQL